MTDIISEIQQVQDPGYSAFAQNMAIMNQIVAEMKEIPILPSEVPKDVAQLTKVEFPEAGGVLTWMDGHEQPYKGFPFYEFVDRIDFIKKITRSFLSGLYHSFKDSWKIKLITVIPAFWVSKIFVRAFVYTFYRMIERFRIKSIRYSDAVRELYRAFSYEDDNEKVNERTFRLQIRDLICMLLEFDNAYRYRFQDVLGDFNLNFKNSTDEIIKLLDIMMVRERHEDVRNTWVLIRLFVKYYIRYDRQLSRILQKVMSRIDLSKVAFDASDIHFCSKRQDYNFKHYEHRILS